MTRILCDTHTHTLHSRHAYSTIEENVRAAAEAGMELLGSTDHFSSMLVAGAPFATDGDLRDQQFFVNQVVWPRTWHGVTLLRGAEADIVDLEGHLYGHGCVSANNISAGAYPDVMDLDDRVFSNLDYGIASVHFAGFTEGATPAQITRMYIGALQNPHILILGHIGRTALEFDIDAVVEAARDLGKLIEINETTVQKRPKRASKCRLIAQRCAELGCAISVGSDAHISCDVGRFSHVESMLDEIGFPEELVSTRSRDSFLAAMAKAGLRVFPDGGR